MPITVQRYLCTVCRTEYNDFNEAVQCETLPPNPPLFDIGEEISFENEESGFGGRWSYSSALGKILHRYLAKTFNKNTRQPLHVWVYIVETKNSFGTIEMEVFEGRDVLDEKRLISPADRKYRSGYAADVIRESQLPPV